jgi:two-component system response regulator
MNSEADILLAEDTPSDAEMTIRAIRKTKIVNNIVHVSDGKEAIDFLFGTGEFVGRDISKKPKVIILDLKMPRLNGIEVLERIRANEDTKKIPVVIFTSSKEDPDIENCYSLGVNSYLVKPVIFDDYTKVVSDLGLYWILHNQCPA